jgi:hypothetical protein
MEVAPEVPVQLKSSCGLFWSPTIEFSS